MKLELVRYPQVLEELTAHDDAAVPGGPRILVPLPCLCSHPQTKPFSPSVSSCTGFELAQDAAATRRRGRLIAQ